MIDETVSDVDIFVAWVNTLVSDGYNLYRLSEIYKKDRNKIIKSKEVINNVTEHATKNTVECKTKKKKHVSEKTTKTTEIPIIDPDWIPDD